MLQISQVVNYSNVFLASGWRVCWHDSYRATTDSLQRNRKFCVRQEAKYLSKYYQRMMDELISFHTMKHSHTLYLIWLIEDAAHI
jgi:hypothetical protein